MGHGSALARDQKGRGMKFGLMSQLQVPKPWAADSERTVYWQNLDHVVAAEDAGFSYFWLTEQHFFAEIGHSASPEMFLAALAQRTRARGGGGRAASANAEPARGRGGGGGGGGGRRRGGAAAPGYRTALSEGRGPGGAPRPFPPPPPPLWYAASNLETFERAGAA